MALTPADWFTLAAERAPALRAAGIQAIVIDGDRVSIRLAAHDPAPVEGAERPAALPVVGPDLTDPLDDPATFGGVMPGYDFDTSDTSEAAQ